MVGFAQSIAAGKQQLHCSCVDCQLWICTQKAWLTWKPLTWWHCGVLGPLKLPGWGHDCREEKTGSKERVEFAQGTRWHAVCLHVYNHTVACIPVHAFQRQPLCYLIAQVCTAYACAQVHAPTQASTHGYQIRPNTLACACTRSPKIGMQVGASAHVHARNACLFPSLTWQPCYWCGL